MQINKFTFLIPLLTLLIWACSQSGEQKNSANQRAPQKEQVKAPMQEKTSSGALDEYGRSPGDPHYGHNHGTDEQSGPKNDSIQKPTSGELDKFGRKPGDPHYGHDHQ